MATPLTSTGFESLFQPADKPHVVAIPNGDNSTTAVFNNSQPSGFPTTPISFRITPVLLNDLNAPQKLPLGGGFVNPTPQNPAGTTPNNSTTTQANATPPNTPSQPIVDSKSYISEGKKNVTKKDVEVLEAILFANKITVNELRIIYQRFGTDGGEPNANIKFLLLNFLVYGFDYQVMIADLQKGQTKKVIDKNFIKDMQNMVNDIDCVKILKKTPAYAKYSFDNVGAFGVTHAVNASQQSSSPITGPSQNTPSLVTDLMEKIHPGSVKELETICNKIRTHSWLSLPKGAFGSLGRIIQGINKVVESFEAMISNIYQGCIRVVQQVYAQLNGIVVSIQKKILGVINRIIPLDLLCLILETIQVLLDDVNFFTSLFQMSGPFLNYLNTFQNYLNITSQFVSNPLSTVMAYMPQNIQNIINTVNQIGSDPNGFLADQLNNYGYGYVLNALQGNILGAIVNKYGPQYAAVTPLGNLLTKGTAIYSRFGGKFPNMPATMGPNVYVGDQTKNPVDVNGSPLDNLTRIFKNQYDTTTTSLCANVNEFDSGITDIGAGFSGLGTDVKNFFFPPKPQAN
jgi:hypothetical protein